MTAPTVTLFVKPDCQPCRATKRQLDKVGVPYEVRDITTDPEAYDTVIRLGYQAAPVVLAGPDNHWSGFRPDRILALSAPAV